MLFLFAPIFLNKNMTATTSSYYSLSRPEVQALVPKTTKNLLDVGCSSGYFSEAVKKRLGCCVVGIEPDEASASAAAGRMDKVLNTTVEIALGSLTDQTFDTIVFNDVLEHLINPYQVLSSCKSLLTSNGQVIASIPNILHYHEFLNILFQKDWKYEEAGIMDKTHLRFFTKKSMIRMFEDNGYQVDKVVGLSPTPSKKMTLISIFSFGYFSEMRYPQFAIIASVRK